MMNQQLSLAALARCKFQPPLNFQPSVLAAKYSQDAFHDEYYIGPLDRDQGHSERIIRKFLDQYRSGNAIPPLASQDELSGLAAEERETEAYFTGRWLETIASYLETIDLEEMLSFGGCGTHFNGKKHSTDDLPDVIWFKKQCLDSGLGNGDVLLIEMKAATCGRHRALDGWNDIFQDGEDADDMLRQALGQIAKDMNAFFAKIACLTWYDGAIFITRTEGRLRLSRTYRRSDIDKPRKDEEDLGIALCAFLVHLAQEPRDTLIQPKLSYCVFHASRAGSQARLPKLTNSIRQRSPMLQPQLVHLSPSKTYLDDRRKAISESTGERRKSARLLSGLIKRTSRKSFG
ncbi:hypothetical protein KVT40_009266 [Elsinoe batatas]|uniref:Uncharacterized protein n=1 Tax=Elsinoe batatas TaxID=2601811 RepID=A0A8K0PEV8_9PEZI|nr:hypothetical protein KVT40_009266 [Elsinoe batatas]